MCVDGWSSFSKILFIGSMSPKAYLKVPPMPLPMGTNIKKSLKRNHFTKRFMGAHHDTSPFMSKIEAFLYSKKVAAAKKHNSTSSTSR